MKKLTFGLIVTLLCAVCAAALFGCSDGGAFNAGNKSFSSIKNIDVSVRDREIEITASDDETVQIEYFENDKEYYEIEADENGNLTVKLAADKKWTDFISTKPDAQYRRLVIKIPAGLTGTKRRHHKRNDFPVLRVRGQRGFKQQRRRRKL